MNQENENNEQEITKTTVVNEPGTIRTATVVNEPETTRTATIVNQPETMRTATIVNDPVQPARVYQGSARTTTTVKDSTWSPNAARIVYYILGVLEALLGIRLVLKLLGANPKSAFVSFIYTVTGVLLAPFNGIFRTAVTSGIETKSILEPANIIAMLIYALIAWGIVKLIRIFQNRKPA